MTDCLDRKLQDVIKRRVSFGGTPTVLSGDPKQCLPVLRHGSPAEIVGMAINRSKFWPHAHHLRLTINMRVRLLEQQQEESGVQGAAEAARAYADYLERVGGGMSLCMNLMGFNTSECQIRWHYHLAHAPVLI